MNYSEMEKQISALKQEKKSLEKKLERREKRIREMERSGPDADLLRANIQLANEVNDLKSDIEHMRRKSREEAYKE